MTPTELEQEVGLANLRADDAPDAVAIDDDATVDEQLLDELLVEEVSIDGMCGVY